MAHRTNPPFRAEHVGSLLRPPEVTKARADCASGRITAAQLRAIEDKAIRDAVRMQEEVGLEAVTDGEMRRQTWHLDFYYQIGGMQKSDEKVTVPFRTESSDIPFEVGGLWITRKLALDKTIFGDDFSFLKSATKAVPKLTIPSPTVAHRRGGAMLNRAIYADADAMWRDFSQVYVDEISALARLGCTYLQIDDTSWASLCDPETRASLTKAGHDGENMHRVYLKAFNDAVRNRPAGMTIMTHTCRGNYRSGWMSTGPYDYIAEPLFSSLDVDGFFLEYDDARSGGFAPLRFVPKGKMVVLGLITTKKGVLEKKDDLKRRIDEAARYVPLDQLCLSPQCGFSSTLEGNALTQDEQRQKLRLVVETAREVWG